jgi:hypothetical protein
VCVCFSSVHAFNVEKLILCSSSILWLIYLSRSLPLGRIIYNFLCLLIFTMNEFNFWMYSAAVVASAFVDDPLDVVSVDTDNNHRQQRRSLAFCYSSCSFDFGKPYVGIASSHT